METEVPSYPSWPPGFWRRIVIQPGAGSIGGALEDDVHRFHLRFDHDGTRIIRAYAEAIRHPWSACPGAAPHIASELTGELLADVANRDPFQHCTHLFDLAVVLAAHRGDSQPIRFDMRVADKAGQRTTATLHENGVENLRWQLDGTLIDGPTPHTGRDLKQLSKWKQDLTQGDAERATILRRAVFVSGARQFEVPSGHVAADPGSHRMGVCYNYQMPQAASSTRTPNWQVDFSATADGPLAGLDAAAVFAAMG
jgi:Protein of unknown function (DUF2889)